jgi:hypothetical protein
LVLVATNMACLRRWRRRWRWRWRRPHRPHRPPCGGNCGWHPGGVQKISGMGSGGLRVAAATGYWLANLRVGRFWTFICFPETRGGRENRNLENRKQKAGTGDAGWGHPAYRVGENEDEPGSPASSGAGQ